MGDRSVYPSERRKFSDIERRRAFGTPEPGLDKASRIACPAPVARLRVEKIEGGLVVAGVVVAANCQVALPVFGCLFVLVGIVLTAASYRGPGQDEPPENYEARLAFTGNSRVLGPACIVVGFLMLAAGVGLCLLTRRARRRERRVGFHCPVHGDFYPISPVSGTRNSGKSESGWRLCFGCGGSGSGDTTRGMGSGSTSGLDHLGRSPPQCPHALLTSTRSSISSAPPSPCPTPMPFLVTSGSVSSGLVASIGANLSPDQTFGSIRSLSVSREVASFPLSRTPSPPPQEKFCSPSNSPTNQGIVIEDDPFENNNGVNDNEPGGNEGSTFSVNNNNSRNGKANFVTVVPVDVRTYGSSENDREDENGDCVTKVTVAHGRAPRKSVSIILPPENNG